MITDFRKHVNGNFDASQLLNRFQKPFSTDHWRFSSPAVMFGAAILIAVVTFVIGKKCCAQARVTAQTQNPNFQNQRPLSSFTPNQREGILSFFTVLFRTLVLFLLLFSPLHLLYLSACFYFLCLKCVRIFTSLVQFHIFYIYIISPSTRTFTNANNPEERERYHT